MEYAENKKFKNLSRFILFLIIFGAIFLVSHFTGFTREYCGTDKFCFSENAESCDPAEVYISRENNVYYYKMTPTLKNQCNILIKFERAQKGTLPEHTTILEGKTMTCKIPKSEMRSLDVLNMENVIQHCSGPLKEALYELIVKRMYELIVLNLNEITSEAQKAMRI